MYVQKRDGTNEAVSSDEIRSRIEDVCYGLSLQHINVSDVVNKVTKGLYNGVSTTEVDNLVAETCAALCTQHPDYAVLAARIAISNMHKQTSDRFSFTMAQCHSFIDPQTNKPRPLISDSHYQIIIENSERLDSAIDYNRDFNLNYFGFKTLEGSYLLKINGRIVERPQQMWMRVAVGIHGRDIDAAIETYNLMSQKYFTHATPTLFNAMTPTPQLSSCFILTMKEDSIEGVCDTLKQCAVIAKHSGGIGISVHSFGKEKTYDDGINGKSNCLVPMLKLFNDATIFVNQTRKRPSSMTVYLEPWHPNVYEFLDLRKNTGMEENRTRDLFTALWIPDLFMERVIENGYWCLMCPKVCPGLAHCWGDEFKKLYESYERKGQYVQRINARDLFRAIYIAQAETGGPFMVYKDTCNRKSNQQNLGTIMASNLCTEIIQYSAPDEIAVCNLASIALNMFVNPDRTYDFEKLKKVTKIITRNLNKVIDVNYYPLSEAEKSNMRHRPIGIGVQGLADAFILMRLPYDSPQARQLNVQIFETLYHSALEASCELAEEFGSYETYNGSPVSKGILQYEMWNVKPTDLWDWNALKGKIAKYGIRNSLLIALMPTASTAQILGNNESFEPYTSNMFCRRVCYGEFQVINNYLVRDLTDLGLWNDEMKNNILAEGGSIQNVPGIPEDLKRLYRTAWEIPLKSILEMAADRGAFVDQSQSLNIYLANPTYQHISTIHFYGWRLGLKTGMYYLRTKPAAQANQFTVDKTKFKNLNGEVQCCSLKNQEGCLSCGS